MRVNSRHEIQLASMANLIQMKVNDTLKNRRNQGFQRREELQSCSQIVKESQINEMNQNVILKIKSVAPKLNLDGDQNQSAKNRILMN
jgi:hypothetical protein